MRHHSHNPIQERVIIINNNKIYLVAHKVTFLQCLVDSSLEAKGTRHQFLSTDMSPDMNIVNIR